MSGSHPEIVANKLAVLGLIESTDTMERFLTGFGSWYGPGSGNVQRLLAQCGYNRRAISNSLPMLGGFAHKITSADGSPDIAVTLIDWHGRHPEDANKHLWIGEAAAQGGGEVMLGTDALAEIRDKLQSELSA